MKSLYLPDEYTRDIIDEWAENHGVGPDYEYGQPISLANVMLGNEYRRLPVKVFNKTEIQTLEAQMRAEGKL